MHKIVAATTMYALLGLMMLGIFGVAVWVSADDCIHYYMCAPPRHISRGCVSRAHELPLLPQKVASSQLGVKSPRTV